MWGIHSQLTTHHAQTERPILFNMALEFYGNPDTATIKLLKEMS